MQQNITHLLTEINETNLVKYCTYNQYNASLWVHLKFTQAPDAPVLSYEEDIVSFMQKLDEFADFKSLPILDTDAYWSNERNWTNFVTRQPTLND